MPLEISDPIDLDHIDRLLAAATPGPWELVGGTIVVDRGRWNERPICDCDPCGGREDAALIATLVAAAPAMVAELRRLRAEVAGAREEGRREGATEERAAAVAFFRWAEATYIERGKHREEGDNG